MSETAKPTIALIGAGSRIFSFKMCTDICQTLELKGATVRLVDVDADKLGAMRRLFELVSDSTGMDLKVAAFTDRRQALSGANFVIVAVARQRIQRWEKDLELSRRHGIIEAQAECGGPGGLSLTLRNIPLILEIARDVEKLAPKAVVLNFSNPMVRVCHALNKYTKLTTVGLCHQVLAGQRFLSKQLGRDLIVQGCGTNHFNWIYAAAWKDSGQDAWPAVVELMKKGADVPGWVYSQELFRIFGWLPSAGDGHMSDFMFHWRGAGGGFNPRYPMQPKEMKSYYEDADAWEKRIASYLSGAQEPMAKVRGLSGEGAIPILSAMFGLTPAYREIAANLPNDGYIPNLSPGATVEVPARVSKGKIVGETVSPLPVGIKSLIQRQLDIVDLAVDAAVEGSYDKALQALAIDPIIADLAVARSYLDDVLAAHRDFLPRFA